MPRKPSSTLAAASAKAVHSSSGGAGCAASTAGASRKAWRSTRKTYTAASSPPAMTTAASAQAPCASAASISSHLARKPPEGGRPISVTPASAKANSVSGRRPATPATPATVSRPVTWITTPAAANIAALARPCDTACMTPAASAGPGAAISGKMRNR